MRTKVLGLSLILTAFIAFMIFIGGMENRSAIYYADPTEADQMVTGNGRTIYALATKIGTGKKATIKLVNRGFSAHEDFTCATTRVLNYPDITFKFENGARLKDTAANASFTWGGQIKAEPDQQIFSWGTGTGNVLGLKWVYVDWFGTDQAAIQLASTAASSAPNEVIFNGDYTIDGAITAVSNRHYRGEGRSSITQSGNYSIFTAEGTKTSHLSNISIKNLKMIGQQNPYSNHAIDIRWCDYLTVSDNIFNNIKPFFNGELSGDAYADLDTTHAQTNVIFQNNISYSTVDEGTSANVAIRMVKNSAIRNNNLVGHTTGLGGALEIGGGGVDPAGDGAPANVAAHRRSYGCTMSGNTLKNFVSGLIVSQSENIVISGNALDNAGELVWIGACKGVVVSNNTAINSDDAGLQVAGINEDIKFIGNDLSWTTKTSRAIYIQSEGVGSWGTTDNLGPIVFSGNTLNGVSVALLCSLGPCTILEFRGNTFRNIHLATEEVQQLIIENNSFTYDSFYEEGATKFELVNLAGYNTQMLSGLYQVYTIIRNNVWVDRTNAWTTRRVLYIYDPGVTSSIEIIGNTFHTKSTNYNIMFNLSTAAELSAIIRENRLAGLIDFASVTGGATKYIYWDKNYALDGQDYFGAAPATAGVHYFSKGSKTYSNDPSSTGFEGWVCITAGAPGTWKTFGVVTP